MNKGNSINIRNIKLNEEEFNSRRQSVLAGWSTGREIDLEEAISFQKSLPSHKSMANVVQQAYKEGKTLTQPRGGVCLLSKHKELLLELQDNGLADILVATTDSYTRNERWDEAQKGIEASEKAGRSMLNGFPIVNYGLKSREFVSVVDRPLLLLSGTAFPCLTSEMAFASGFSGFLGSAIAYTTSYTKTTTIEEGIRNYQQVDRLAALYADHGVVLHREQPGFLTGTLIPPGIGIAVAVLDTLLAVTQGINYYGVGLCQTLSLEQDVAALHVLPEMCKEYLAKYGYDDVFLPVASHQWMGAFPQDEAQSYALICMGAMIASLGGATSLITKTTHESFGIPTKEANSAGLRATKQVLKLLSTDSYPQTPGVKLEMQMLKDEVRAIVDKVLELGDGDVAVGAVRGFEAGVIDIPWSPNQNVANKVMPARDFKYGIRYLSHGKLPLPQDVIDYHRSRLEKRAQKENRKLGLEMAIEDVSEFTRSLAVEY